MLLRHAVVFFLVVLIICGLLTTVTVASLRRTEPLIQNFVNSGDNRLDAGDMVHAQRSNCDAELVYCFTDQDCQLGCQPRDLYSCMTGVCRSNRLQATDGTQDPCLTKMGMMSFIAANTTFGRYEYLCKSVDPGVAVSSHENRMCYGQTDPAPDINYLNNAPLMSQCVCPENATALVPATEIKRAHVECNKLADILFVSTATSKPILQNIGTTQASV